MAMTRWTRPGRRTLLAGLALVPVLSTLGCGFGPAGRATPTATAAQPSASPSPAPSGEGSAPLPAIPADAVVAATQIGDILVLSTVDGSVRATIASYTETGGPPGHLAIAPDRRAVFFDRGPAGCWSEFSYLGGPGVAGNGSWPAVSADGARVAAVTGADPCRPDVLAIDDIASHQRREWHLDPALRARGIFAQGPLSWSADGRRLALVLVGPMTHEVRIVTVDQPGTLQGAPLAPAQPGGSLYAAFFVGTATDTALITLESCCGAAPTDWRLARRPLVGDSPGPATDVTRIAQPLDLRANRSGEVSVTTRDGAVLVGGLPNLRRLAGRYVAADR